MAIQYSRGVFRTELLLEGIADRLCLQLTRDHTTDESGLHQCRYGQGKCRCWHMIKMGKTAIIHLLYPTVLIQHDHLHYCRIIEISNRRIVESKMSILSYSHTDDVNGKLFQQERVPLTFDIDVRSIAVQVMNSAEWIPVKMRSFRKLPKACVASAGSPIYSSI